MSRLQSRSQNGRRRPEWKAIKDLYHYEIDFTEEPISKSAGRPPPSKLLTGRQYRNIDDSSLGPNCVAARNCQNTLTEATFIRDANGVLSKWAQNQQQQQQQQQQPQQQQQQQRQYSEKILKILKSARIESRQNPGEAYDAYLVVEGVGAFGICLQMHARFTTGNGAKGALQDNYTFKKQPYVIKTNQLAICFTGQRFFVATGGDVDKYLKSLPDGGDGVDRFQMGVGGLPVEPCNDMNSLFLEIATLVRIIEYSLLYYFLFI